jgi:arginine N-succinyltransferase
LFFIRAAQETDLPAVAEAARHLDSVNLPSDRQKLTQILDLSVKSFSGKVPPAKRELMFVLVERTGDQDHVVGSSMIFAQHGNRQAPHVYFDAIEEERYSETLDRHFKHTVLRIGYNYQGLTEVGGLVVLPSHRGHKEQLGKLLAYVRFLYVALHREVFRDEVVSELMPPLESDGRSLLWEALGRHFTGLSYQEADRLSRENKEFIRTLFPQDPIYASLLPASAQGLIGQVGPTSKPVERLLRRIGFQYAHRIDPFDGGPHFHARTDEISLVKGARRLKVGSADGPAFEALVAVESAEPPFFRALRASVRTAGDRVALPPPAAALLGVSEGQEVGLVAVPAEGS